MGTTSTATTATLTFDDEFNSLSLWNGTSGTWATTFWYDSTSSNGGTLSSNDEQEWYINSNDPATATVVPWTVGNGVLNITAAPASSTISPLIDGYQYTSGMLNSYHSFSQTYGFFEVRAKLPSGQGFWPAFWLLPENGSWPPELDVMENLGSNLIYTTVHSASAAGTVTSQSSTAVDTTQWNTYGVDWEKNDITWYVNGVAVYQVATPADMNTAMYMVLNLAVGGIWPGDANSTTNFANDMQVDWVRVYSSMPSAAQLAGSTATSGGSTISTTPPTTAAETLTSATIGSVLTGGTGYTTFYPSQGNDVLTGGTGGNDYIFIKEPWSPDTITNFKVGTDKLDLSALFANVGYTGSNPIADGYIYLLSDGNGGTIVRFDSEPAGPNQPYPNTIIDLEGVSPTGLTWAALSGASVTSTSTGGSTTSTAANETLTSTTIGSVLTGGSGYTTFYPSQGNDVLTGGTGGNDYIFSKEPWSPDTITNFKVGTDKLDLSALFASVGYTGSNPVADGYIYLLSDGSGGTIVRFDHSAAGPNQPYPNTIIDLKGVSPTGLTWAELSGATTTSTTTTTTTSTTTSTTTTTLHPSTLLAADSVTVLSATANWSGAAMLSSGQVVAVGAQAGGWGSEIGAAAVYGAATGVEATGVALQGYTPAGTILTPTVTALAGGYWEVAYTGTAAPAGYEIYNASGHLVSVDNLYTSGSPTFAALDDGAAVTTNTAWNSFALTTAGGQTSWLSEASVGGTLTAPSQIQSLSGGGFVFDYAGSTQLDVYSAAGAHVATAHLGAAASSYAMATAETTSGGFAAAWLSPTSSGGEQLTYETFDASGNVVTAAVTVAADADAAHTQIKILPTAVASESVLLWSQGGTVWSALANGASVGAATAVGTGSLAGFTETALSNGNVVLTWVQKDAGVSDVWAEVLNPTTMSVTEHLLGAGTGDAQVAAMANGGFAVSWHNGSTIEGVGYHGDGTYGQTIAVSGDFLGLDAAGQVVALGHAANGAATLQHYTLGVDPLTGV